MATADMGPWLHAEPFLPPAACPTFNCIDACGTHMVAGTSDAAVAVIRVRDAAAEADGPDASAYLRKARLPSPRAGEAVTAIALSPCSRLAGLGTSSGRVFVLQVFAPDAHKDLFVAGAVHDHGTSVSSITFCYSGARVFSGDSSGGVMCTHVPQGVHATAPPAARNVGSKPREAPMGALWSKDHAVASSAAPGERLLICARPGFRLWVAEHATGKVARTIKLELKGLAPSGLVGSASDVASEEKASRTEHALGVLAWASITMPGEQCPDGSSADGLPIAGFEDAICSIGPRALHILSVGKSAETAAVLQWTGVAKGWHIADFAVIPPPAVAISASRALTLAGSTLLCLLRSDGSSDAGPGAAVTCDLQLRRRSTILSRVGWSASPTKSDSWL
ncbi:hypothetical protein FNF29_01260 [Cafeteria roenbergensis]|uniref:Uncharacterized protein n=1 Tax=Cafeteria roenbergensis TaxID=33653 RepID=A0A5A8CUG5_CAFRO|nr:hypothetical protein FNF29_01260 [Cafeteria roenbergensis]|eukprot:KAA0155840.1 hypothetical protein FNF29_01260 [Cafeteria roenbergensis]